ncbi:MAG: DUF4126 family protein [Chthoniobacterales bacterium]|jgi:uncharacterized membrane protein
MSIYLLALLIGVVAGLRAMTAPAVTSWAARLGWLNLTGTPLAFLNFAYTPYILTVLALAELIGDKLPFTPSRKRPLAFAGRILTGALCGGALTLSRTNQNMIGGLLAGAIGAVIGTLGGAELRTRFADEIGKDFPIALVEDVVAIGGAFLIVSHIW